MEVADRQPSPRIVACRVRARSGFLSAHRSANADQAAIACRREVFPELFSPAITRRSRRRNTPRRRFLKFRTSTVLIMELSPRLLPSCRRGFVQNHAVPPPPPGGVLYGTPHSSASCGTGCSDGRRRRRSGGSTSKRLQTGRDVSPFAEVRRTRREPGRFSTWGRPLSALLTRFVPRTPILRTGCLLSPDHRSLESLQPAPLLRGSLAPQDTLFASEPHKTSPRRELGSPSYKPPDAGAIQVCPPATSEQQTAGRGPVAPLSLPVNPFGTDST